MKPTGIVKRVDDLGRVVIPRELRRKMGIVESDPVEFFINDKNEIMIKKYLPSKEEAQEQALKKH